MIWAQSDDAVIFLDMKRIDSFLWLGCALWVLAMAIAYQVPKQDDPEIVPVIFVGDSITRRLPVEQVVEGALNLGVESRTTKELLDAIPDMGLDRSTFFVLMIGTNDLRQRKSAGLESRLREIGRRIPGYVIWNAIPPMPGYDVSETNALIQKLCRERGQCTFLSIPWTTRDFQSDGVHPNSAGNDKWIQALRTCMPAPTV